MTRQYDTREITHGVSFAAFAKVTKMTDGTIDTTIEPKIFTGLRGTNIESEQSSKAFYADNTEHVRLLSKATNEGEITCYQEPRQFAIDHLGKKEVLATGALLNTGKRSNFIWQYIESVVDEFGDEYEELHVWYNVQAGSPTGETVTDEEEIEAKEITIPITASPNSLVKDSDGEAVTDMAIRKTAENAALFDLAYVQIIMPDTPVPSSETPVPSPGAPSEGENSENEGSGNIPAV